MNKFFFWGAAWLLLGIALPLPLFAQTASEPTRDEYEIRAIEGWTVHIHPSLLVSPHEAAGEQSLQMLGNHLQRISILVPPAALKRLQRVEFCIEWEHPEFAAMCYHPSEKWLTSRGYDAWLAEKVHIVRARELLSAEQMRKHPAVILHELAHAYHHQFLGFDQPEIVAAFRAAEESGRYENVLSYNGDEVRHYGLSNPREYFAEGTEAYFYRNDFFPFVNAELRIHDPQLHTLLGRMWGN